VTGAKSEEDARQVAKRIVASPLVKTALHGADPNWGRLMAALGSAGVAIVPEKVTITIDKIKLVSKGEGVKFDVAKVRKRLMKKEVLFVVDLGLGSKSGRAFGCDLSPEYVTFNAKYHT
jgi:glutamate N-acetyltransferase/amino-acid N-acetyltransferase